MNFSDIPGQRAVIDRLRNSVTGNRVSHALLFYGPEGSGKLPLALAFARYVSCENRTPEDACGACPSCVKYDKLIHPDLHFVFPVIRRKPEPEQPAGKKGDPAAAGDRRPGGERELEKKGRAPAVSDNYLSHWRTLMLRSPWFSFNTWTEVMETKGNEQPFISVAEAAEILRKLSLKSFESDFKIMIIWLPEKMNTETANKLLKIIEEPPAKTLFLLIAEEEEKLLPTITSRCQHILVPAIPLADMEAHLQRLPGIDPGRASEAAAIANGNMVRAMELLSEEEQGTPQLERFIRLMRSAYGRNLQGLMEWSEEMAAAGRERQKSFLTYALRMIRENFILNFSGKSNNLVSMTRAEDEFSVNFHPFINQKNIDHLYREFNLAYAHVESNGNTRMIFLDLALRTMRLIR